VTWNPHHPRIARHLAGSEELLRQVADAFVQSCPEMLDAVGAAVTAGDAARLRHAAHDIKGAIANFRASDAEAAAFRLELPLLCGGHAGHGSAIRLTLHLVKYVGNHADQGIHQFVQQQLRQRRSILTLNRRADSSGSPPRPYGDSPQNKANRLGHGKERCGDDE
jgi:hypothetical protein